MSLPRRLRSRLGSFIHGLRRFRGNLDGYIDGALVGWVVPRDLTQGPVKVGLYAAQGLITQATANLLRGDLVQAGIGTGYNGFSIGLDPIMLRSIRAAGGRVQIKTLSLPAFNLGSYDFGRADAGVKAINGPAAGGAGNSLSHLLFGDLQQFRGLLDVAGTAPAQARSALGAHGAIFARKDHINGGDLPALMNGYSEYVRYRYKLDQSYDPQANPDDAAHFLSWYLGGYSTLRNGLRVPIAKPVLEYLNAPVTIPGQRASLSRATWSFLMNVPPILHSMSFQNPDWVAWAVYWWAIDQAKAMHVEDCLVPQSYVDLLGAISETSAARAFAPSQFLQRLHNQTPALASLNLEQEADRRQLILAVMVMAVQRPDYLRYVPVASLEALLSPGQDGVSDFARFCRKLMPDLSHSLSRADYAAVLRLKSFDLDSRQFLTFTPEGHRIEVASLLAVASDEIVDLQLIGPFEKASGLGQATRLSAAVIEAIGNDPTPITVNSVNFGLDNPAPEGFSRVGELSGYKRARINLIHLNAESIPLAYAYQPDVFSGAYNIGYFFWELDTPAACHYLGMNMLDEIWVSTEYGVQIYAPESRGPVTNVGMCFEDLPEIPRAEARAFVQDRFGFDDGKFVFLVAFDSFSFVQRKNPIGTLKAFKAAFEDVADVRLVIKTQNRRKVTDPVQEKIWREVDALIKGDARIVVLDETLSYGDLLKLKKGCDAYVSLHKSEGWGFGMIEAMNLGVPVICTGYSGNMDFCTPDTAWLVRYAEVELQPDDYIFVRKGQKWAEPDVADAAAQMRMVYDDPVARQAKADAALANVRQNFSAKAIALRYEARFRALLKTR
jgi:glycosyltransferase involved in cell wall biosynthesis